MLTTVAVLCLTFAVSPVASAQTKANLGDEVGQSEKAAKVFGEIGQRSDMVLMAMRDHDAEQIVDPFLDERQIGQDDVDAGILRIGKGNAEIDHHPFALAAIQVDVHADFAGAAKATEKEFVLRSH